MPLRDSGRSAMRLGSKLLGEERVGVCASTDHQGLSDRFTLGDPYCAYLGGKALCERNAAGGMLILAYRTRSPEERAVLSWERFLNGKTTGYD